MNHCLTLAYLQFSLAFNKTTVGGKGARTRVCDRPARARRCTEFWTFSYLIFSYFLEDFLDFFGFLDYFPLFFKRFWAFLKQKAVKNRAFGAIRTRAIGNPIDHSNRVNTLHLVCKMVHYKTWYDTDQLTPRLVPASSPRPRLIPTSVFRTLFQGGAVIFYIFREPLAVTKSKIFSPAAGYKINGFIPLFALWARRFFSFWNL